MNRFLLLFYLCWPSVVPAQTPDSYTFRQRIVIEKAGQTIQLNQPVTAIALLANGFVSRPNRLVVASDTFALRADPHAQTPTTQLLVLTTSSDQLSLPDAQSGDTLTLIGVYARPLHLELPRSGLSRFAPVDCQKPAVIAATTWRSGLTPPKDPPTATTVRFVIVHHEAGSNTTTDYTNVVRNIYVFHTQSNGWNDVGYNFLVAQDGTIFEGRDGRGVMDGDNVLGAHFCGTNTGTMGICLLGNYMTAQPTTAALASLNRLITWKLNKEGIADPLGGGLHTSSGKMLQTISAHRDGTCATDCPGDNLYALMGRIRTSVTINCVAVQPVILATEPLPGATNLLYPNPTVGATFTIEHSRPIASVQVTSLQGQQLEARFVRETLTRWRALLDMNTFEVVVSVTDTMGSRNSQRIQIR